MDGSVWKREKDGNDTLLFEMWKMVPEYKNSGWLAGGESIYYTCYDKEGVFLYQNETNRCVLDGEWEMLAATDGYCYLTPKDGDEIFVYEEKTGELIKSGLSNHLFLYPLENDVLILEEGEGMKFYIADLSLEELKLQGEH